MIPVQFRMVDLQNDTFRVYFSVSVVSSYVFDIVVIQDSSQNQSFTRKTYDISKIYVSDFPKRCMLSEKCEFQGKCNFKNCILKILIYFIFNLF